MLSADKRGEPDRSDPVDLTQRFVEFRGWVVPQSRLEAGEDVAAATARYGKDERESEFPGVFGVELLETAELLRGATVKAGPGLLASRFHRQVASDRGAAGQVGVRAD